MVNLKEYVDYLNTLHNASALNENAIAENQILNKYYKEIKVERDIENILYKKLEEENILLILTGHAGDGKTSLLNQFILKDKNKNEFDKSGYFSTNTKEIFYVKDLSEYNLENQYKMFEKSYSKSKESSSVLVSNVGPLIDNLKKFFLENNVNEDEAEDKILDAIDKSNGNFLEINNKKTNILIINIARVNNIPFIRKFIDKILEPKLWKDSNYEKTNIYKNLEICSINKEKLIQNIENFYIWQYEYNERSTIRQMIAHIAYSLTGNSKLEEKEESSFINNNFAHYFLGYKNDKLDLEAQQIDSIRKISELKLDEKKIENEHKYFVEEDYLELPKLFVEEYEKIVWDNLDCHYLQRLRKSIRRNTIFWSGNIRNIENLYGEVFGKYLKMKKDLEIEDELQEKLFKGISRLLTGLPLEENMKRKVYLTLRREGNFIQNIQLIRGEIEKRAIRLYLEKDNENQIEKEKYELFISLGRDNKKEKISYPLLNYILDLERGCVKTDIDPHLSNGIENLKNKLIKNNKRDNYYGNNEFEVLVSTNKGSSTYEFNLSEKGIIVK